MRTEAYSLPSSQPLTEAYIHRTDSRVESLFGYHSAEPQDYHKRFDYLEKSKHKRASAADMAAVLREWNSALHASPEAMASIDLLEQGAPVVVGGQQAGLWSGPLLVIHKAVTIINAAKSASEQLGKPVIPVFWIAGEDHDWDEVNHAFLMTADQGLRKLSLPRPEGSRTSVSRTVVTAEKWEELLAEVEQALPHSEFKDELLQLLNEMTKQSQNLTELFALILSRLFGSEGLVLMDADDPQLRILESPMFRDIIERNDELEKAYAAVAEQVKDCGYTLQSEVVPGGANLFVYQKDNGDERTLLFKRDGMFKDRKEQIAWSKEELLDLAMKYPQQLSNNVLTRPLMQDYVLPVLATVLGPGEIAYWALTGEAFRTLDMQMPIVVPRMSFTLVEGTIAKHMQKYELTFDDVHHRFKERKELWLKEQDGLHIEERFAEAQQAFRDLYTPLLELASGVQPGLSKLGEQNIGKILEQMSYMQNKTVDAFNKQFEASIRQLDRIELSIKPAGKPQERMLNMLSYWNRYGTAWVERLLEAPYSRSGGHIVVYL